MSPVVVIMYEEMHPSRSTNPPPLYSFNKELSAFIRSLVLQAVVPGMNKWPSSPRNTSRTASYPSHISLYATRGI